ncbi:alkanesulfonate monooxygenase SsuD/methylene tetrahydromethanopterin reductase-like flavin-dependent oxidoreductase (luciferase family) [Arthrobacter stackebrandtii]|uniref:Alkanesulfonate monooxygenase SsuD/methylene tetrahydromethanopterin reductase-like flavin-dependent oxidoreductase (Luciferase family) n=1 Tax=Arthrobacter stackebrandtii TaxID=272161 RepID=A0ABS4YU45_9MICC|nr:LLM class flavin-dependent oxidoreductase [Arthrobacter stackebrandtii]MBP2412307.1 alkanesulfonate monooxygenase SsuD/methylene tetrahydromethanopterin reductase-like flavin-dependent oxidoreductase (luciferase family) [Arthrobacter stackebrandtii]PYH02087.1 LLM class flavin-dependent oxidoreductase [Arthrobacter stackebrandtii]
METTFKKRIGFLSFGHYGTGRGSQANTAADSLHQAIDLAVAAEELGIDGAFFRVHHFARQQASPFPLMAAIAARTSRIEIGTGVIDMRYENPLYMAEQAAATDLISDGRLQIGVSRGSPEPAANGAADFGYHPLDGETVADMARRHTASFRHAISGAGVAEPGDHAYMGGERLLRIEPQSPGLSRRIWWGAGSRATAVWAAQQGMNLMSSTLLTEDTGVPFDQLQAEQIQLFRDEWAAADHDFTPRVSVSRSVIPVVDDVDQMYFGLRAQADSRDQVGMIDGLLSRFGKSYMGDPAQIAAELAADEAVRSADTLMLTVPNQLGVAYNSKMLANIAEHIAPAIGWVPNL